MNQKIDLILELAGEKIGIAIPPEPDLSLYVKKDELVENIDKHKHVIADIDQLPEFRDETIETYSRLNQKIDTNKNEFDRHVEEFRTHRHSANDIDNLPEVVNVGNLPGQAATSGGTAGVSELAARNDHTHPLQTSVSGNAGTATKLATSRTITLSGDCTGSTSFDGSGNVTIATTVLNGGVQLGNVVGQAAGTASAGVASTAARSDHVHPLQTTVSGNAGSATKLQTSRTITLSGAISGSTFFDGSGNVTLTTTSNIVGLQLGNSAGLAAGTAAAGTATTAARSDHVHPLQTTVSGNAGSATKLQAGRTITLSGAISGSTSFDGSGNVTITTTSNITGLQLGNTVGSTPGTASAGTATTAARSDHVHPKQELEKYWFGTAAELPDSRSDDVIYYVTN